MKKICNITSAHKITDTRIRKTCLAAIANKNLAYIVAPGESFCKDGITFAGVGEKEKNRFTRMIKMTRRVYKKAVEIDADVYILHDMELLPYALKLKKLGKKVIFDSHENYYMQIQNKHYLPKFLRLPIAKMYRAYETRICKKIDAVLFPCPINGKNIFENRANRTLYIDNLPLLEEFYIKYKSPKEKTAIQKNICHVGGLTYNRGITHLIKAANKAGAKLILAGEFKPAEYGKQVADMEEFNCVDYKGFCNREEVFDVYVSSNIAMCTILNVGQYNKTDNFPTKVYEYMSMGLPVILSNSSYATEVLKEYEFGITVEPDNIEEIADAIEYLISNPDIAKKMGENGRRAVAQKFNWSIEQEKLIELFNTL